MELGHINPTFMEDDILSSNNTGSRDDAVQVRDVCLSYGKGDHATVALNEVNLTVPKGLIYALIGPSGCGKTSLLCSLIGLKCPQSGSIRAFGESSGTEKCGVPGSWVGFMPQELCLYAELTPVETLRYFGRLQRMPSNILEDQLHNLIKLLDLTKVRDLIFDQLSGGQQRRLSLAAALLHRPPLVILDEPTVGVDPVLRLSIWDHLLTICSEQGTAIIITTHYIEEARKAHQVGVMRGGRILKEGTPDDLMKEMNSLTLEGAFTQLCAQDEKKCDSQDIADEKLEDYSSSNSNPENEASTSFTKPHIINKGLLESERKRDLDTKMPTIRNGWDDFFAMILAVTLRNLSILRRNIIFLVIAFVTPLGNVIMVKLLLGHTPFGLTVSVSNTDQLPVFSQLFLERVDNRTIHYNLYDTLEEAIETVRNGKAWAALHFPRKYTVNSYHRNRLGFDADNASLLGSVASLYMDETNVEITRAIYLSLLDSMKGLAIDHVINLGDNPAAVSSPIVFEAPIFGTEKTEFTDFLFLNMLPDSMFLMAMALSALTIINERSNGLFSRSSVYGLKPIHVLISHMCIQNVVTVVQTCTLLLLLVGFKIQSVGSLGVVAFLCFLQSNVGLAVGILISTLTDKAYFAMCIITSIYQCNLIANGALWPIESFPYWFRRISYCGPETFTIRAVREIINRGLDWTNYWVWSSIGMCFAWTAIPLIIATLLFRRTNN